MTVIETTRPGASFYPFPEAGAPEVITTTIDPDLMRQGSLLYSLPTTEGPEENTVGESIIYSYPT